MTMNWLRRTAVLAACASAALLTACGSSTVESAVTPTRIVSFGDALSDVGQTGVRYTINDGSTNIWSQQFAESYGRTLTAASAGGKGYARGNARVVATPDAAGFANTLTLTKQIDAFLAADAVGSNDMVVVNGGTSDVISQMAAVTAGTQTAAQMVTNSTQAGRDLGTQVRRLVNSGAKYVVVAGTYDLGRSPWATAINRVDLLSSASSAFNQAFLVSVVDLGANVLYIDAAYYFNLLVNSPGNYNLTNSVTPVCTSVDSGNSLGIGTGKVSSTLCNTSTLIASVDPLKYAFADSVYFTPVANRLFGVYAYDRVRARW